jgi:hypothetical protein
MGISPMIYSYTQISQYLRCPRSYRYRYLDGWREKDARPAMAFGRCFEAALAACFSGQDPSATLFKEWEFYRETPFEYSRNDSWDKLLHQGVHLLHLFVQQDRVRIIHPPKDLQAKMIRLLENGSDFVAYIDAIGELDGQRCLIDWKTTSSRYPGEPEGLLGLDPQLVCYSWISGIREVALVVFVRKNVPEIQYLKTSITEEQCSEFGRLVESTINQIETGQFPPRSGIRFPMNGCTTCSHLGLCLGNQRLITSNLVRRPGADDLDWLDQLAD